MKPGENIDDMQMRFYDLVNHLASLGKRIPNVGRLGLQSFEKFEQEMAAQGQNYNDIKRSHNYALTLLVH